MELDARNVALVLARARAVAGVVMLVLPGVVGRLVVGGRGRAVKTLVRMLGARDLVLGIGAVTMLKERAQDAEWVGMGAVCDGVDALALSAAPVGRFRRGVGAGGAAAAAAIGLLAARRLADARADGSRVAATR